jgi:hypothetical protein
MLNDFNEPDAAFPKIKGMRIYILSKGKMPGNHFYN